jgi:hypothetical protein
LIVETKDRRAKLWVQVKTGAPILKDHIYLTQCAGDCDLTTDKFDSDFVVFVNLQTRVSIKHAHRGELGFEHLTFFVVPADEANTMYRRWLQHWHEKPKRDGGARKLTNMALQAPASEMAPYQDAWHLLKERSQA